MSARKTEAGLGKLDLVLKVQPGNKVALSMRGVALFQLGRFVEALENYQLLLRSNPKDLGALGWQGLTQMKLQRFRDAEVTFRKCLSIAPNHPGIIPQFVSALLHQAKFLEALKWVDQALVGQDGSAELILAKAQILRGLNWGSQAIEWYRRALNSSSPPQVYRDFVQLLLQEGQTTEAVTTLESIRPRFKSEIPKSLIAQAYTEGRQFAKAEQFWIPEPESSKEVVAANLLLRANSEIYAGRLGEAETIIVNGLELSPEFAPFYSRLLSLRKASPSDQRLIEQAENLLNSDALDQSSEIDLSYALGKAYNDLGDYADAIMYYDRANRIALERNPIVRSFDCAAWGSYTDFQIGFFTRERIKKLGPTGLESDLPLFIVGMIRSGTTLVEQIISRHSEVRGGGETTFWPDHREEILNSRTRYFDSQTGNKLGREFLSILGSVGDTSRYVSEKNPSNVILSGMLHCIYPNAKLVNVSRNPLDTALSIWMTPLSTGLPFVYSRENIVFALKEHARLQSHFQSVLPEKAFQTFSYESLTSKPTETIGHLLDYLNLARQEECYHPEKNSRTVRTPSYYQVRQPINENSQNKWKNYEPWLGRFAELMESP